MAGGASAADALAGLRADDELVDFRQVGMMTADGRTSQWTGANCVPSAGGTAGEGWIAQANMVESPRVWEAMGEAFEATAGPLALRLLAALDAAEAEGGDWRGRGGAGIVVVPAEGERWERVVDLRVEDGDTSLVELRRLLERALGYREANRADRKQRRARAAARPPGALRPAVHALRRGRGRPTGRGAASPRRARGAGPALARRRAYGREAPRDGRARPVPRGRRPGPSLSL